MKVTHLAFETDDPQMAMAALVSAFAPFGSLSESRPMRQTQIAARMVLWASARVTIDRERVRRSLEEVLLATDCDQASKLTLAHLEATLTTPTSGTAITVHWDRRLCVSVAFGLDGSESRAAEILARSERHGVIWRVSGPGGAIPRDKVLAVLRERAKGLLGWFASPACTYGDEERAESLDRCRDEIRILETAHEVVSSQEVLGSVLTIETEAAR